jgi:hypothetical protein
MARALVIDCALVQRHGSAVPDNTRPPRSTQQDPPTLGVRVIMSAVDELAQARGIVGARVAYKMNAAGEHVVALIFPSQPR